MCWDCRRREQQHFDQLWSGVAFLLIAVAVICVGSFMAGCTALAWIVFSLPTREALAGVVLTVGFTLGIAVGRRTARTSVKDVFTTITPQWVRQRLSLSFARSAPNPNNQKSSY
jgi:hypothetical protein